MAADAAFSHDSSLAPTSVTTLYTLSAMVSSIRTSVLAGFSGPRTARNTGSTTASRHSDDWRHAGQTHGLRTPPFPRLSRASRMFHWRRRAHPARLTLPHPLTRLHPHLPHPNQRISRTRRAPP